MPAETRSLFWSMGRKKLSALKFLFLLLIFEGVIFFSGSAHLTNE